MDLELDGKVAMVTGGTRGIGRAIVEVLLEEGCRVALCARNAEGVTAATEELAKIGPEVMGSAVDVSDSKAVKDWVNAVTAKFGRLDVFVSNVSALARGTTEEDWLQSLKVDVLCPVAAMEVAKPFLESAAAENGDAAVLAISSVSGNLSMKTESYGAMKAALDHYMSGLAKELALAKVRVNALSPGTIFFDDGVWGNVKRADPDFYQAMVQQNPMKRMGTPREVANAAAFLVSPKASFVSGSNMMVDGAIKPCVSF